MSYIELLDKQIVNFYRSHNYWWPDEIVMSQNTMDKLKQEMRSKGFYDWKGNKFNYVSLKISNEVEDDKFVLVGAPELRHRKCSFCGIVNSVNVPWHKLDDGFLCEDCYRAAHMGLEVDFVARDTRVEKHNKYMKYCLDKKYLKYYENYLFNTPVKSAYDDEEWGSRV